MFFTMPCPSCGKPLKGRDDLVGKTARCPYCRTSVTVRRPDESAGETEEPEAASGDAFNFASKPVRPASKAGALAADAGGGPAATPKPPARRPAAAAASAAAFAATADTNVSVLLHALVGLVGTAVFYALLWPIAYSGDKQTYLGRLFIGASSMSAGGWVPDRKSVV